MTEKPRGKATQAPGKAGDAGRLGLDDRGNVTWEWNESEPDLVADDPIGDTARVRALVDPRLQVKDDDVDPLNPIQSNPKGLKTGYNPYNSGALAKQGYKKKRNLKDLSKWIELRKKIAEKKEPGKE
jgi:hypothetical protein